MKALVEMWWVTAQSHFGAIQSHGRLRAIRGAVRSRDDGEPFPIGITPCCKREFVDDVGPFARWYRRTLHKDEKGKAVVVDL